MSAPSRMPVVFFGHGSPMNAIEPNRYADAFTGARHGDALVEEALHLGVEDAVELRGIRHGVQRRADVGRQLAQRREHQQGAEALQLNE